MPIFWNLQITISEVLISYSYEIKFRATVATAVKLPHHPQYSPVWKLPNCKSTSSYGATNLYPNLGTNLRIVGATQSRSMLHWKIAICLSVFLLVSATSLFFSDANIVVLILYVVPLIVFLFSFFLKKTTFFLDHYKASIILTIKDAFYLLSLALSSPPTWWFKKGRGGA